MGFGLRQDYICSFLHRTPGHLALVTQPECLRPLSLQKVTCDPDVLIPQSQTVHHCDRQAAGELP